MKPERIVNLLKSKALNREVSVFGWVRTRRGNKHVNFIAINDGSCLQNIQAVIDLQNFKEEDLVAISTGSSIKVTGQLVESQGKGQSVEVQVASFEVLGKSPEDYPLQKKGHTLEFLREIAHLRPRTNTFGAVFRVRHHLGYAVHKYFNDKGYYYVNTPVITTADAEGAGEAFRVSTLPAQQPPINDAKEVDFSQDFFGREAHLTVSGQLEGELLAMGLGLVYTFGPTFRAENSNTPRHLAEFWMIEPEMAFYDIHDNMDVAEDMLKYLIGYALEHCKEDLEFLNKMYDKKLLERLQQCASKSYKRITYTEAVELLEPINDKFEFNVKWGDDLQKEHETYLVEHFDAPVIIRDYPKTIKPFYMKQNEDGKTVRGMDVLFPYVGEIIGGSQREENEEALLKTVEEKGMDKKHIWWYLESRKFGTCVHSGFGLGFERLVLFITGMNNVRDIIPFPRTPKSAEF